MRRLIPILLVPLIVVAGTKYAGEFEELGVSARTWGLGGTSVASPFDPSTIYYNPAGIAFVPRSAFLMHQENYRGMVKNDFAGISIPARPSAFGVGVYHTGVSNIVLTTLPDTLAPPSDTNPPESTGVTSAADWIVYLNYARTLAPNLAWGGNAKIIYRTLGPASAFGMGIDAGLLFKSLVDIGVRVRNVSTSPLFWSTGTRELILPRAALGLSKVFHHDVHRFRLSLEQELQFEGMEETALHHFGPLSLEENFGFEYSYRELLAGRIGFYKHRLCFGLGGRYRNFNLDYAYESFILGANHRISGGIVF